MKTAIVLGARQELGFQLCEHLLENDYAVFANDFLLWQDETHEEKWLYIGRNAHLHYMKSENIADILKKEALTFHYIIIPLIDFYLRDFPELEEPLIKELTELVNEVAFTTSIFVFIQPTALEKRNLSLSLKMEQMKLKMKHKFVDILVSNNDSTPPEHELFFQVNQRQQRNEVTNKKGERVSSCIIHYLEENHFIIDEP